MDEKDANALVKKLIDVAYEAGFQHNSNLRWNCQYNTMDIGNEIIRHLTSKSSQPPTVCAHCGQPIAMKTAVCAADWNGHVPPPA